MFCPKCGDIAKEKKTKDKIIYSCKCGFKKEKKLNPDNTVIEGVADESREMLPVTDEECPKCNHKKAYFWTIQTRAGDEAETKFLKCTKCKHTWRDYD